MSRQRTKRRSESPAPARFSIGDHVRVRHGVMDVDHPDLPLGGWAGTISEIHKRGMYTICWSRETLASIHPIYKKRCAIEGQVLEEYCLGEDDLEADPGGSLAIEIPTRIVPRPLSHEEQGDRVRMIFGLTSDDFLPAVDEDSLETYYDHLVEQMVLPADARYCPQEEFFSPLPARRVKVVALDCDIAREEDEGILCKIRMAEGKGVVPLTDLEFRSSDPNHQLRDDFSAWFFGDLAADVVGAWDEDAQEDHEVDEDDSDVPAVATWRDAGLLCLEISAFAACCGALMGAVVAAMPWARWAACIGGGVWGLMVSLANMHFAHRDLTQIVPKFRKGVGGITGLVVGAFQGAFFGAMAVACIGAVLGGIAGLLWRQLLGETKAVFSRVFPGPVLLAAACGAAAQAFYLDRIAATEGLRLGVAIGLGIAVGFCLVAWSLTFLAAWRSSR